MRKRSIANFLDEASIMAGGRLQLFERGEWCCRESAIDPAPARPYARFVARRADLQPGVDG
jgi:hypothetical protein